MNELAQILLDLFLLFTCAKVAGLLVRKMGQPAVIGEVGAGILIGPYAFGLVGRPDDALLHVFGDAETAQNALQTVYNVVAELGVIVLLFFVGLETRLHDLLAVGRRSAAVGLLGVLVPFILGFGFFILIGRPHIEAAFIGTALVATSVGITARVLRDLGVLDSTEARIILGAAVVDDILALLFLAVLKTIGNGAQLAVVDLALTGIAGIAFVVFAALIGRKVVQQYSMHLERIPEDAPLVIAIVLMLGLSVMAGFIGLAAIIGAFLAGMILAEAKEQYNLEHKVLPLYQLLVPFFFAIIGTKVDWRTLTQPDLIGIALAVTGLAVAGKMIGASLAMVGMPGRSVAIVGVGMVPRGEVGLVVAGLGASIGIISREVFSVVVFMSIATSFLAPPVLSALLARPRKREGVFGLTPSAQPKRQDSRTPDEETIYTRA
jgi:Kef-type K+ transport system membrane component KefB